MLDERSFQTVSTPFNIFKNKENVETMLNESLNQFKFDSTHFQQAFNFFDAFNSVERPVQTPPTNASAREATLHPGTLTLGRGHLKKNCPCKEVSLSFLSQITLVRRPAYSGDHLRFNLGITSGWGSFAARCIFRIFSTN